MVNHTSSENVVGELVCVPCVMQVPPLKCIESCVVSFGHGELFFVVDGRFFVVDAFAWVPGRLLDVRSDWLPVDSSDQTNRAPVVFAITPSHV